MQGNVRYRQGGGQQLHSFLTSARSASEWPTSWPGCCTPHTSCRSQPRHYPDNTDPPQCTVIHAHKLVSHLPSGKMQCRATSTVLPLDSSFTSHLSSLLHVSTTALCHKQSSHFTSTRTPGRTTEKSSSLCKHNSTIQCWQPNVLCKFGRFYRILRHYTAGLEVAHGPKKAATFTFKGLGLLQPWWWRHHKSLALQGTFKVTQRHTPQDLNPRNIRCSTEPKSTSLHPLVPHSGHYFLSKLNPVCTGIFGTAMWLWAGWPRAQCMADADFSLLQNGCSIYGAYPASYCVTIKASRLPSRGVKRLGHEVDNWALYSATPILLLPLHACMACTGTISPSYGYHNFTPNTSKIH